jgi:hypothetical protein
MTKKQPSFRVCCRSIVEGDWGLTDDDGGEAEDRAQQ